MEEELKKKIGFWKDVIVAFSILIAIEVLIGVYYLATSIFDTCDNEKGDYSTLYRQEVVQIINNRFIPYTGEKVTGTNVRDLIDKVIKYNLTEAEDSSQYIAVQVGDASKLNTNGAISDDVAVFNEVIRTIRSGIKSSNEYKVTYGQDKNSGLIIAIGIEEIEQKENNEVKEK